MTQEEKHFVTVIKSVSNEFTKEEQKLLVKDICSRLPYGIMVRQTWQRDDKVWHSDWNLMYDYTSDEESVVSFLEHMDNLKPYLRPMSSMTEEELELLKQYSGLKYGELDLAEFPNNHKCLDFYLSEVPSYAVIQVFDWLNAHHFDYRLLIERGLALEAPKDMYKTE